MEVPADAMPWTQYIGGPLRGVPGTARTHDLINYGILLKKTKYPHLNMQALAKGYFCNTSQDHQRKPFMEGSPGALCTSTELYSYEHNAMLSGMAHLLMMGHSQDCAPPHLFSEQQCKDLAGEGLSVPWTACLLLAAYANPYAPWNI